MLFLFLLLAADDTQGFEWKIDAVSLPTKELKMFKTSAELKINLPRATCTFMPQETTKTKTGSPMRIQMAIMRCVIVHEKRTLVFRTRTAPCGKYATGPANAVQTALEESNDGYGILSYYDDDVGAEITLRCVKQ